MGTRIFVGLMAVGAGWGQVVAIEGGTLIDGNGGAPVADAVVVVDGARIAAVGPRGAVKVPAGASIVDARGKVCYAGVHRYQRASCRCTAGLGTGTSRWCGISLGRTRSCWKARRSIWRMAITTVRDSYGMLMPLIQVRDSIARGEATGARILAAGNIVGWGGPYSITFSLTPQKDLTLFQEQMNDYISQGAGEDLADMTPAELRVAIDKYLDKGPDFLKYGGTSHFAQPTYIGFSPEAQKVMVEEAHKRGKVAETHSTTIEGLRLSIQAGIDLIQHPELLTPREMPDDLVEPDPRAQHHRARCW